jgi:hypothetical protein
MPRGQRFKSIIRTNYASWRMKRSDETSEHRIVYSAVLMAATRSGNHLIAGFASCLECKCILTANSGNSTGAGTATTAPSVEKMLAMRGEQDNKVALGNELRQGCVIGRLQLAEAQCRFATCLGKALSLVRSSGASPEKFISLLAEKARKTSPLAFPRRARSRSGS